MLDASLPKSSSRMRGRYQTSLKNLTWLLILSIGYISQSNCGKLYEENCSKKTCHPIGVQRRSFDDIEYPHYPTIQAVLAESSNSADLARSHDTSVRHILPSGPPPFRPTTLLMSETSSKILSKIKRTQAFKQIYKSKAYYLFLDVIEQLGALVDNIATKKIQMTKTNIAAIQTLFNKILQKSGQKLKLKWPLVMLNPNFLRELLSNPTFLVMLFHTIETAYVSLPTTFWLKPLVKLVKQPSPEKEEQVWWRRKRIYETLNGLGSSELQPNLKTQHFRQPGRETTVAIPDVVSTFRKIVGLKPPNPAYFKYPPEQYPTPIMLQASPIQQGIYAPPHDYQQQQVHEDQIGASNQAMDLQTTFKVNGHQSDEPMYPTTSQDQLNEQSMRGDYSVMSNDWLNPGGVSQKDLLSQGEFDSLDQHEKDRVFREFHGHMQESNFINDLIRKQDEYVDSIVSKSLTASRRRREEEDAASSNVPPMMRLDERSMIEVK